MVSAQKSWWRTHTHTNTHQCSHKWSASNLLWFCFSRKKRSHKIQITYQNPTFQLFCHVPLGLSWPFLMIILQIAPDCPTSIGSVHNCRALDLWVKRILRINGFYGKKQVKIKAGWWQLKYCLCSSRTLGKWSNLTSIFCSDGLVQPPSRLWSWSNNSRNNSLHGIP